MPTYRQTLSVFPTVPACFAAIDTLHARFKREHKRNATVALCYSLTATPDPKVPKSLYTQDTHAITLHADNLPAQQTEIEWFAKEINTL